MGQAHRAGPAHDGDDDVRDGGDRRGAHRAHDAAARRCRIETGGFTAFITWSYQPEHTEHGGYEATGVDYLRTLALSRIVLDNFDNLQASWVTQGGKVGQLSLAFGANDMGSVMIEENVVRAAGASYCMDEVEIVVNVEDAGFTPKRRNMHYEILGDPDLPRARRAAHAVAGDRPRGRRRLGARGAEELSGAQPPGQSACASRSSVTSCSPASHGCRRSRSRWMLPIGGRPIRDGWVVVEGGRIAGVGTGAPARRHRPRPRRPSCRRWSTPTRTSSCRICTGAFRRHGASSTGCAR